MTILLLVSRSSGWFSDTDPLLDSPLAAISEPLFLDGSEEIWISNDTLMWQISATWSKNCLGGWTSTHNGFQSCHSKSSFSLLKMLAFSRERFCGFLCKSIGLTLVPEKKEDQKWLRFLLWNGCQAWPWRMLAVSINEAILSHLDKWVLWE